jgi:hypothetical protein
MIPADKNENENETHLPLEFVFPDPFMTVPNMCVEQRSRMDEDISCEFLDNLSWTEAERVGSLVSNDLLRFVFGRCRNCATNQTNAIPSNQINQTRRNGQPQQKHTSSDPDDAVLVGPCRPKTCDIREWENGV